MSNNNNQVKFRNLPITNPKFIYMQFNNDYNIFTYRMHEKNYDDALQCYSAMTIHVINAGNIILQDENEDREHLIKIEEMGEILYASRQRLCELMKDK